MAEGVERRRYFYYGGDCDREDAHVYAPIAMTRRFWGGSVVSRSHIDPCQDQRDFVELVPRHISRYPAIDS